MKIIVTTSNKYLHLVPIFCYMFNKNWSYLQEVEIVGYDKPDYLPDNFTFHSLGKQEGSAKNFTTDLRKYFEQQDEWFIWFMEDSWVKSVDLNKLDFLKSLTSVTDLGRINLTYAGRLQDNLKHILHQHEVVENTQTADYRLCTQPSLWNKKFLLQYMTPNMTPWEFETQKCINDGWRILGLEDGVITHNEGVTKHDIHKYDLNGIPEDQIQEMLDLKILNGEDILKSRT